MSEIPKFDPNNYAGFALPPNGETAAAVARKVERYRRVGNHTLSIVMDWDDTAAEGTWPILRNIMPAERRDLHTNLYRTYGRMLRENTITPEQSDAWQRAALGCLVGLKLSDIEEAAREHGRLRAGTKELFDTCAEAGIVTSIRTAAIEQFVKAAADEAGIVPDEVIATRLLTDDDGFITGWMPGTMTHSHNKGSLGTMHTEHAIVLGDGMADRFMVPEDQDALLIRANGGYTHNADRWLSYLGESFDADPPYELVTVESNLIAVSGLVEYIAQGE
jgi:phosphoserine phosphatase